MKSFRTCLSFRIECFFRLFPGDKEPHKSCTEKKKIARIHNFIHVNGPGAVISQKADNYLGDKAGVGQHIRKRIAAALEGIPGNPVRLDKCLLCPKSDKIPVIQHVISHKGPTGEKNNGKSNRASLFQEIFPVKGPFFFSFNKISRKQQETAD